jgi:hypothetical protein
VKKFSKFVLSIVPMRAPLMADIAVDLMVPHVTSLIGIFRRFQSKKNVLGGHNPQSTNHPKSMPFVKAWGYTLFPKNVLNP